MSVKLSLSDFTHTDSLLPAGRNPARQSPDVPKGTFRFCTSCPLYHCPHIFAKFSGALFFLRSMARIQLIITSFCLDQLIVSPSLYDPSLFQHHDAVRVPHRRKSVGDHKCSSAFHQTVHAFLYQRLCPGIYGRCGLVQNQCRRRINPSALASFAAAIHSSSVASSFPYRILSMTVPVNRWVS